MERGSSGLAQGVFFTLAWLDRTGKRLADVGEVGPLSNPSLSPDGKRAIVSVNDGAAQSFGLWIYDLARNLRSRFTFDRGDLYGAIWSRNGSQIIFSSVRKGQIGIYRKMSSGGGEEELLYMDGREKFLASVSPDGKYLMYSSQGDSKAGQDLLVLPLEGERKPFPFLKTEFEKARASFLQTVIGWRTTRTNLDAPKYTLLLSLQAGVASTPGVVGGEALFPAGVRLRRGALFYIAPGGRFMAVAIGIKGAEVEMGAASPLLGSIPSTPPIPV